MSRDVRFTVALDWPKTAGQASMFTAALEAEFAAAKETKFRGPYLGIGVTVHSSSLPGNRALPRIWRRLLRYLQNANILGGSVDPWCYGMKVVEIEEHEAPHVVLRFTEEP